ncbi:hypothetical protein UCREL1_2765 [Eutypa lata UCREL1]|uniref:Uncharacterized protein n=1 Tax=Eutypa lata (strain UCR-EL1) TaxID=1287681 RepID=M7T075_EUTLA|nr:hypothetical protein UCREL1_2765 [Eutypa lata UCREL1]
MCIFSSSKDSQDQAPADSKKSLYTRYHNARIGRDNKASDEDLEKYTGKSRVELEKWAETTPGVGKNQVSIAAGSSPGIAGDLAAPAGPLGTNRPRDFSK